MKALIDLARNFSPRCQQFPVGFISSWLSHSERNSIVLTPIQQINHIIGYVKQQHHHCIIWVTSSWHIAVEVLFDHIIPLEKKSYTLLSRYHRFVIWINHYCPPRTWDGLYYWIVNKGILHRLIKVSLRFGKTDTWTR